MTLWHPLRAGAEGGKARAALQSNVPSCEPPSPTARGTAVTPFGGVGVTPPLVTSPRRCHTGELRRPATMSARDRPLPVGACRPPWLAWRLPQRLSATGRSSRQPRDLPVNRRPEVDSGNHGNAPETARCQSGRRTPSALAVSPPIPAEVPPLPPRKGMVRPSGGGAGAAGNQASGPPELLTVAPPLPEYANEGRGGGRRTRKRRG